MCLDLSRRVDVVRTNWDYPFEGGGGGCPSGELRVHSDDVTAVEALVSALLRGVGFWLARRTPTPRRKRLTVATSALQYLLPKPLLNLLRDLADG